MQEKPNYIAISLLDVKNWRHSKNEGLGFNLAYFLIPLRDMGRDMANVALDLTDVALSLGFKLLVDFKRAT